MKYGRSLNELASEIDRQAQQKEDFIAPSRALAFRSNGTSHLQLGATSPVVGEIAHGQIQSHLDIPAPYYRRLREGFPTLLDENINTLLQA